MRAETEYLVGDYTTCVVNNTTTILTFQNYFTISGVESSNRYNSE